MTRSRSLHGPSLARRTWTGELPRRVASVALAACLLAAAPRSISAQSPPDRVLTASHDEGPDGALAVDRGAARLWREIQKARTTASVLYTAGHPDDEEAGVLTLLGRGLGVRTALLTLNRGEGGANAIGAELFDALGLVRTEELRLAGRYYGLDDQYFTTAADYGYSKTLDEAMRSWDREALLDDMVRVIRINRPLVVISRWHGSERDGHGHHQASGVLTPEAVGAAADPSRFPEQITREGLRPWRVPRVLRGRLQADEPHDVELDPHVRDPWLGDSYAAFGVHGLSLQRSQTSGRVRRITERAPTRYERLDVWGDPPSRPGTVARSLFDGLDTSLDGVGTLTAEPLSPGALAALGEAERHVEEAAAAFDALRTTATLPHLVAALAAVRRARGALSEAPESDFLLAIEERQIADAVATAAGIDVSAVATPEGAGPSATMGAAVPGQRLDVHVEIEPGEQARLVALRLDSPEGWGSGTGSQNTNEDSTRRHRVLPLAIPADAEPTRPWFHRPDIRSNRYLVRDSSELTLGTSRPRATVVATFAVGAAAEPIDVVTPVRTLESAAPYGVLSRPLEVVPAFSLSMTPHLLLTPPSGRVAVAVEVRSNAPGESSATVGIDLPQGWMADPAERTLTFSGAGRTLTAEFTVSIPPNRAPAEGAPGVVRAWASSAGRVYREGFDLVAHRDLRSRRLYRDATLEVHTIDVAVAPDLRVGYVMGVGDDVPSAIARLGASVTLLGGDDLARGGLDAYDAILVGTRAYAVRPDLVAANHRLLDYARSGGNLVVLYQTPEYIPEAQAPWSASLPGNAEEVSEEDAPVTVLAPDHPLLRGPNRIGPDDFTGWIEQRGSKFFASWDDAYTPLVETHDTGQAPQRGVWLTAEVGDGRFTYVALALHRQLPYGVPGAYRILANLISAGHR